MQNEFKQIITKFYDIVTQKKQLSNVFKNALERYLNYVQLQQEKNREKDRESQQIKSYKSATSTFSTDSYNKIKKLFHSTRLQTAILFSYFLQVLKNKKNQLLAYVLQKISERLLTVKKRVTNEQKKRFQIKFNKFSDQLIFLSEKAKGNAKIDWLYYQVFTQFESQCVLLSQLLSSTSDQLQSFQNIKDNDYATLNSLLKFRCSLFDKNTKESKIFGSGEIKIFIGRKVEESYFILTQKQFELQARLSKKDIGETRKKIEGQEKGLKQLKKYPTLKFKEQFLAELQKLKQDYEVNTAKIATLFNFKDCIDGAKSIEESRQA